MPDEPHADAERTTGAVPRACPGCGHAFHPAGECEHEWREYGVDNPSEQRCTCQRNIAIRLPDSTRPGGSGSGSTYREDPVLGGCANCKGRGWHETWCEFFRGAKPWEERDQLRADLEAARGENTDLALLLRNNQERREEIEQRHGDLLRDLAQARAREEAFRAAVRDIETDLATLQHTHSWPRLTVIRWLRSLNAALDAAQAAGAGQEQPCCSQDQPHTSNPKCPAGEKHWVSSQWSWAERPELQLADDDVEPPGEPGSYKRAIGALGGKELRMSPETAVRRGRDNDRSEPVQTEIATRTHAEGPQEAI